MKKLLLALSLSASIFSAGAANSEDPRALGTRRSAFTRTHEYRTLEGLQANAVAGVAGRTLAVFKINHVVAHVDVFNRIVNMEEPLVKLVISKLCIEGAHERREAQAEGRPYNVWKVQNHLYDLLLGHPKAYELAIDMLSVLNLNKNPFTVLQGDQHLQVLNEIRSELRCNHRFDAGEANWEVARALYSDFLTRVFLIDFDIGPFDDADDVSTPERATGSPLHNSSSFPAWCRPGSTDGVGRDSPVDF